MEGVRETRGYRTGSIAPCASGGSNREVIESVQSPWLYGQATKAAISARVKITAQLKHESVSLAVVS